MSSIPKAMFIQKSDEGTDVFFLTQVGVASGGAFVEAEWQVERQRHIPNEHVLDLFGTIQTLMPEGTLVESDPYDMWFVQHEVVDQS